MSKRSQKPQQRRKFEEEDSEESFDSAEEESEQSDENISVSDQSDSDTGNRSEYSSDVHLGKTLFIRNISYSTSEETLKETFEQFGELNYCLFVRDKNTGEFKGTAFVQYKNKEDADRALEEAYKSSLLRLSKPRYKTRKDLESDIIVDGRNLIITRAVNRREAHELKEAHKKKKQRDPRNLALAELGVIRQDSDEFKALTPQEKQKVIAAQRTRNQKLANPNYHVSRTRLCIRNLPKDMDEKQLKELFKNATDHLKAKNVNTKMKQVKVVRDPDRNNQSKGFGFVEFFEHEAALAALKKLHNKPEEVPGGKRLFLEFALENKKVLLKRMQRQAKQKEMAALKRQASDEAKQASEEEENEEKNKKKPPKRRGGNKRKRPSDEKKKPPKKSKRRKTGDKYVAVDE